jgi:hypothetical protein
VRLWFRLLFRSSSLWCYRDNCKLCWSFRLCCTDLASWCDVRILILKRKKNINFFLVKRIKIELTCQFAQSFAQAQCVMDWGQKWFNKRCHWDYKCFKCWQ